MCIGSLPRNKNLAKRAAKNYTLVHCFAGFLRLLKTPVFGLVDVERIGAERPSTTELRGRDNTSRDRAAARHL